MTYIWKPMNENFSQSDALAKALLPAWGVTVAIVCSLIVYLLIAQLAGPELQGRFSLGEEQRIVLRTVFYLIAIITLPLTNLIRHILLRLNQTMPGATPAKQRYLVTVLVSMAMVETIGIYGFVMFLLGDEPNTLYILTLMSALGIYLYRPKVEEYESVLRALADKV